jgi:hypothetical protein
MSEAESVKLTFQDSYADDPTPRVTLHNPSILPYALFTQVLRFGLMGKREAVLTGKLKGTRLGLTDTIKSFGLEVEIVHA